MTFSGFAYENSIMTFIDTALIFVRSRIPFTHAWIVKQERVGNYNKLIISASFQLVGAS